MGEKFNRTISFLVSWTDVRLQEDTNASWEHVQKTASSKQTPPPLATCPLQSQDRERAQGSRWWWIRLEGVPGLLPEASFLLRSFPLYTLQRPGLMGNFSLKFCLSNPVTHFKIPNGAKEQTMHGSPIRATQTSSPEATSVASHVSFQERLWSPHCVCMCT